MNKGLNRLLSKVNTTDPTQCWLWLRNKDEKGYGYFWYKGKALMAHRVAYHFLIGKIPDGRELDHLCNNTSCINPAHLEPVTGTENIRRYQEEENGRLKSSLGGQKSRRGPIKP